MNRIKIILVLAFFPVINISVNGQRIHNLSGRIICNADSAVVEMAAVVIKELNIWTVSDVNGNFIFKSIPGGDYTLQVTCLGYEPYEIPVSIPFGNTPLLIRLDPSTLSLDEVVVTAKEGRKIGSTSILQQSALEHIQPTDLSDVLQLVPGSVVNNPDLSDPKQLSVREIDGSKDPTSSLGILLIIDGAPVFNDANLQVMKTTGATLGKMVTTFASTSTGGSDIRQIPVDNIESVEVVRGIAGAEDGDMLSGAVKVKLKRGKTPLIAKIKTDPMIKQFYAGKGIGLGGNRGALNIDFDVTRSFDDLRLRYKSFNRLNGGLAYSNTFMRDTKPLRISLRGSLSKTQDREEKDPDLLDYELYESSENIITGTLSADWSLNSAVLTNLDLNISGSSQHQVGRQIELEQLYAGPAPQPISLIPGEFEAPGLPSSYISDVTIDGRPFYFNAKLDGSKVFHFGNAGISNTKAGLAYKLYGNNGDGRLYDTSRPPSPASSSDARPRSYKDIPSMKQLAMYIEENLDFDIGSTSLSLQAGLRFTNVQPQTIFRSAENATMLDPRLSLKYSIIDRNGKGINDLKIRLGYGVFSKAPTLLHYYPDPAYFDRTGLGFKDGPRELFVISTKLYEDTSNDDLRPAVNRKVEMGVDLGISKVKLSLTAFYERMNNGFSFERYYDTFIYNNYANLDYIELGLDPEIHVLDPYFVQGQGVFYIDPLTGTETKVPVEQDTVFVSYTYPLNCISTTKKGLELSLDLGRIEFLKTSVIVDGAYLMIKRLEMNDYLEKPLSTYMSKPFPLVGLYPGGEGTLNERINTNIRTVTHISKLKMVFTITTQIIWYERKQTIYEDPDGNILVYTNDPVENPYTDYTQIKYIDAIGYYDLAMNYHIYTPDPGLSKPYSDLTDPQGDEYIFSPRTYPPVFQVNLRVTKEISDETVLSFYVNNVTNYRPLQKISGRLESYERRNQPIYFGAELKFKF